VPRFIFSLEGVWRHRRDIEAQRQRDLADTLATQQALEEELRQLGEEVQQANQYARSGHLVGPLDMSFVVAHRRFLLAAQRKGVTLMQRIALVRRQVSERRALLLAAARDTKVLEKLRERQWEEYSATQRRREAAEADEAGMQIACRQWREDATGGLE
jgi:flagellar export protein FliJ